MRDTRLSRRQASRIANKVAARFGIYSAASRRSRAVADTIERLLTGSSRTVCRELLTRDGGFTPEQVRLILRKAVVGADQEEIRRENFFAQARCEANEYGEKCKEFEQAKAMRFLDVV